MRRSRRSNPSAFSLIEVTVALAIISLVFVVAATSFGLGKKDRAGWDRQIDDVYALINGLERIRRELEVSRLVAFPPADNRTSAQREFLVAVNATGCIVVYGVVDGNLVADTFALSSSPAVARRVMIPRVDRVLFHHRTDTLAVRFQVFMGGMSLVSTVRPANGLVQTSFDFATMYGI